MSTNMLAHTCLLYLLRIYALAQCDIQQRTAVTFVFTYLCIHLLTTLRLRPCCCCYCLCVYYLLFVCLRLANSQACGNWVFRILRRFKFYNNNNNHNIDYMHKYIHMYLQQHAYVLNVYKCVSQSLEPLAYRTSSLLKSFVCQWPTKLYAHTRTYTFANCYESSM